MEDIFLKNLVSKTKQISFNEADIVGKEIINLFNQKELINVYCFIIISKM